MIGKYACLNGQFIKTEETKISIDCIELMYGFGVYENLKIRKGKLFFTEDHIDRLLHSAKQIELKHSFKKQDIKNWIEKLINKNKQENANIKMILLGGNSPKLYIFMLNPLFIEKKDYRNGVKVITYKYERFLPQAKTLNMLPSYIIFSHAKKESAFDALLLNKNDEITEGTRTNFFAIKNTTLFTPAKKLVLDGITRKTVIDCATQQGYNVEENSIGIDKIFSYDGAFLTSTSSKIVPIKTIDNKSFDNISPEIKKLMKHYNNYLNIF